MHYASIHIQYKKDNMIAEVVKLMIKQNQVADFQLHCMKRIIIKKYSYIA